MSLTAICTGLAALAAPLAYLFLMLCIWAIVRNPSARWFALGAFTLIVAGGAAAIYQHSVTAARQVLAFENACRRDTTPTIHRTLDGVDRVLRDYSFTDSHATRLGDNVAFSPRLANDYFLSGFTPLASVGSREYGRTTETTADERSMYAERLSDAEFRLAYSWREEPRTPEGFERIAMVLTELQTSQELATQPVLVKRGEAIRGFPSLWFLPTHVYEDRDRSCPSPLELAALVRKIANRQEGTPQ